MPPQKYEPKSEESKILIELCDVMNAAANKMDHNDKMVIKLQTINLPPIAQAIDADPHGRKLFSALLKNMYEVLRPHYDVDQKQ